jgi:hypothetical protein
LHYVKSAYAITDVPDAVCINLGEAVILHDTRETLLTLRCQSWFHSVVGMSSRLCCGDRNADPQMAERVILRCHPFYCPLRLPLSVIVSLEASARAHGRPQGCKLRSGTLLPGCSSSISNASIVSLTMLCVSLVSTLIIRAG